MHCSRFVALTTIVPLCMDKTITNIYVMDSYSKVTLTEIRPAMLYVPNKSSGGSFKICLRVRLLVFLAPSDLFSMRSTINYYV